MISSKARIGVFGGSFDPVHLGHLLVAETALEQLALSQVLFMPTNIQPFKQDANVTPADDRVRMLRMATKSNPRFGVSTVETDRAGVSYTIDSLRTLQAQYGTGIVFILGADMLKMISQWSRAQELLTEFSLAVGIRPGSDEKEVTIQADDLRAKYGTMITPLDNIPIHVSSTELRARMKNGESVRYLIPDLVRIYLEVRRKEGERRFAHTKRVMDLAESMAGRFGEDPEKAALAALLHDYEKDPAGGVENDLAHGPMAAEAARNLFAVEDEDVLNAIRWHTTGRAGMSRLELIVFLADTVEPGRTYDSIDKLRGHCLEDLERGAAQVLAELKKYLEKKGLDVSPDTLAAIADLKGRRQPQQQKGIRHIGLFGRRNND
ncbi:MAG: nicotinate-nucleotide adenylyltransferase [Clostridiales Family XIII bacterium]|nr:nicotinate-nucleotide adenylyltransferase [Clostridiales Family XIII bacterium]